jgi:hypothetical protein
VAGPGWPQARACATLQPQSAAPVEDRATVRALRLTAQRALSAYAEAEQLEKELLALVAAMAPLLLAQPGVGPVTAAQLLISWSHPGRFRSEAAFAMLAGVAPVEASSGKVVRHRLNRGGDRQLNRALHTIVMIRRATTRRPRPTPPGAPARARANGRSAAASSARSPASCTACWSGRRRRPRAQVASALVVRRWRARMPRGVQGAAMASPRLHIGPVRGPTVLGVLVAGVLITALVVTGRWQHQPPGRPAAQPPASAAATPVSLGSTWACPLSAPVPVFADHRSYPPGHPAAPPPTIRPVGCYQTTAQAAAAGWAPASPPAGTLAVGGVYLTATGSQLRRRCQHAADGLGFAVPCPTLLPAMSPGAAPPAPCDQRFRCLRGAGFVLEEDGFVVPPGYVGAAGQAHGRLVVAAASRAGDHVVTCEGQQQPIATVTVRRTPGHLVQCTGSGVHYDSVLVRWRERSVVMVVSVLGHNQLHQQLAITVADHAQVVLPTNKIGGDR